mmetsp:Transcript_29417/g.64654  ORF Transcript_29417/g.64654 Transcript_29417/m.64654 type:complete len:703 (-) Transcript_29417:39-2147(-)
MKVIASLVSVAAASEAQANPIRRVVSMLQDMQAKIEEEGKRQTKAMNKYRCYCKSNDEELSKSITDGKAYVELLESKIQAATNGKTQAEADLKQSKEDRAEANKAVEDAQAAREKEAKEFAEESGEMKSNIEAMGKAIPAIEKGMGGSFLQVVQNLAANSVDISAEDKSQLEEFLQGTSGQGYEPASGQIVGILKQMKETMEGDLADLTKQENESIAGFNGLNAAKNREIQASTDAIEENMKKSGEYAVGIVTMKGNKEDTEDALASDEGYLTELEKGCEDTMKDYELVKQSRSEELAAVADTINILNDDDALDLFKKALPTPESFLQVDATFKQLRAQAAAAVRNIASHSRNPGLDLLTMAMTAKTSSFEKVMKQVDGMVDALHKEQADDDSKKQYCKDELHTSEQTQKELQRKLKTLAHEISDHDDNLVRLHKQVEELEQGIKDLDKAVEDATQNRKDEHEEYLVELQQNQAAMQVLDFAKNRLNKFYNPKDYKAAPKRELTEEERMYSAYGGDIGTTPAPGGIAGSGAMAFVQIRAREEDSDVAKPPPAPKVGGFKKQNASGGVLGMIDMIVQDLKKEMQEHEFEEKQAQEDYEKLMEDSAAKRAADAKSISAREGTIAEREQDLQSAKDASMGKMKEFQENQEYMADVHKSCDFLLENFGKRKEARAQEVEGLKKAKAILAGADVSLLETSSFMHRRQ